MQGSWAINRHWGILLTTQFVQVYPLTARAQNVLPSRGVPLSHSRLSRGTGYRWVPAVAKTTAAVALAALIGACSASTNSGSGGQGAGTSHTLHTAFSF